VKDISHYITDNGFEKHAHYDHGNANNDSYRDISLFDFFPLVNIMDEDGQYFQGEEYRNRADEDGIEQSAQDSDRKGYAGLKGNTGGHGAVPFIHNRFCRFQAHPADGPDKGTQYQCNTDILVVYNFFFDIDPAAGYEAKNNHTA